MQFAYGDAIPPTCSDATAGPCASDERRYIRLSTCTTFFKAELVRIDTSRKGSASASKPAASSDVNDTLESHMSEDMKETWLPICAMAPSAWTIHAIFRLYDTGYAMMTPETAIMSLMTYRDASPLVRRDRFLFSMGLAVHLIMRGAKIPEFMLYQPRTVRVSSLYRRYLRERLKDVPEIVVCDMQRADKGEVRQDESAATRRERQRCRLRSICMMEVTWHLRARLLGAMLSMLYDFGALYKRTDRSHVTNISDAETDADDASNDSSADIKDCQMLSVVFYHDLRLVRSMFPMMVGKALNPYLNVHMIVHSGPTEQ
jgi:hypothetical protein